MTDEVGSRLFPGRDGLTRQDAHGVAPAAVQVSGEVQSYAGMWWIRVYHAAETGWDDITTGRTTAEPHPRRAGVRAETVQSKGKIVAVLAGVDEFGERALYDVPDAALAKYKLNLKPMTDELRAQLFPGRDTLTKEDAQGVLPAGPAAEAEVEGYVAMCWYWCYCEDASCAGYWEAPC